MKRDPIAKGEPFDPDREARRLESAVANAVRLDRQGKRDAALRRREKAQRRSQAALVSG